MSSPDRPVTIITVDHIARGKDWIDRARSNTIGHSPAMDALGLGPALPPMSFDDACRLIDEYDALNVKRD